MSTRLLTAATLLAALSAAGCATVPRDAGFGDVERAVTERTGKHVRWNRATPADESVAGAVRSMLQRELGPDEAVQVALLNNRNLQATYEDLGVAQAEVVQAGLLKNPVFDGDLKFSTDGGGTRIELAVVQDFLDVLLIPLRQRIAETAFDAAKLRVTGAVLDLAGQVRAAFYSYEAAEQTLDLRRSVAAATEASFDLAKRLRAAGNMTQLDLANERATYEQAKLDLAQAETAVLDARERLNALMGLWGPGVEWATPKRLPEPPDDDDDDDEAATVDGIEQRAVTSSLDLAVARTEVEAAARALGIRRSFGLLPEAELGVAAERETDGAWGAGPAFSLPVPLFDQGQAATAAARAELERARQKYAATAVEVRSAARMARNRLLAGNARVTYYRRVILPLRREITEATQLQYNAMQVSPFQLLLAKQAEIDAGVTYIEALRDYWVTRSQVEQVVSGRLPEMAQVGTMMLNTSTGSSGRGRSSGGH